MKKIRWGIIGTSFISEVLATAITQSETGELIAVCSRSIPQAESFSRKFLVQNCYDSIDNFLASNEIDAVYIGLPNHLHKEMVMRSISAGKYVLCEKPFARDAVEASQMCDAIEKTNLFCMEALMYRSHPLTAKIQELVDDKVIGDITSLQAAYHADIADIANKTAGGAIRNLGCYPVSLIRLLVGEPLSITGCGRVRDNDIEQDAQASALMVFENNIQAMVSTADDLPFFWQFTVCGTKGSLRVVSNPWLPSQNNNIIEIYEAENKLLDRIEVSADKPLYSYQVDVIGQCIAEPELRNHLAISLQDSLSNMKVLDAWRNQIKPFS